MDTKLDNEASKMLEDALQQMDGIISIASINCHNQQGEQPSLNNAQLINKLPSGPIETEDGNNIVSNDRSVISTDNVLSTAKTLALALQQVGISSPAPDPDTAAIINDWLEGHVLQPNSDERLRRLQRDKEALSLQYQLLTEKVYEQADKITALERLLSEKNHQLNVKDELLQRQLCTRSELETQKLELLSALSELKLHRAALEKENLRLKNFETPNTSQEKFKLYNASFGSMGNLTQFNFSNIEGTSQRTPPSSLRRQIHPLYHSLPRSQCNKSGNKPKLPMNPNHNNNNRLINNNISSGKQRNVAFASNEKILINDTCIENDMCNLMFNTYMSNSNTNSTPSPTLKEKSAKSLRNIIGKLRRSNSGNLELSALEQVEPEFRRGDRIRATAGGRIECFAQSASFNSNKNWSEWSEQEIGNWLKELGLACYEEDCRKWLKNKPSNYFFSASPMDIEKELNLKSSLHRKKIMFAIEELTCKDLDPLALKAAQLDVGWVMRWLDDIGLPQYKDTFLQSKIDGRMLHRLTMEDLIQLQVTSCLHIASLRRGIQCMRETEWNPDCLIRRSTKIYKENNMELDDTMSSIEKLDTSPEFIALWTAHRVMEWLRVADLSEYAPNLRGAGVHGALMLYEPRFNADLLADLLSIPPSKTLLRRHLATHFKDLLGRDVIHAKRFAEAQLGYQPLTISAKIRLPKKNQFSLKRRKSTKGVQCGSSEIDWSDYVCPMNKNTCTTNNNLNNLTASSSSNFAHNSEQINNSE